MTIILPDTFRNCPPFFCPFSGADPGFPVGGGGGGRQPLTQALFGENIYKNERIWSCWGGARAGNFCM